MDTGKPTKTLADFLVIAASPALIMVMVHSVCFFLVQVFYRGEGLGGVRWVLFWFVLAVVLITRIGIEQGEVQSLSYGLALTAATGLYLLVVHANFFFAVILLGTVWFTAHKITTNCTLVDDEADASGQGLMQSLQRLPSLFKKKRRSPVSAEDGQATASSPSPRPSGERVGVRGFDPRNKQREPSTADTSSPLPIPAPRKIIDPFHQTRDPVAPPKKKYRPQTPGVWLIYFGLAALPIFGLGQTLLPSGDSAARHQAFAYLFLYLAAALGLLIATSFLGLRRYLRQRYVTMPGNIALGWIKTGLLAGAVVLCLALLFPRPGASAAWLTLRYHVDHQLRRASDFAARFNPHGTGSGRTSDQPTSGQADNKTTQSGQDSTPSPDDKSTTKGPDGQPSGSQGKAGDNQPGNTGSGQTGDQGSPGGSGDVKQPPPPKPAENPSQASGDKGSGGMPGNPPPGSPSAANSLFAWLRILFWLAVAVIAAWLIYRYRTLILALLQNIWAAIRSFFALLFGWGKTPAARPAAMKKIAVTPFKQFKNPFLTGGDQVWPPEQLITYTYDALQSWAVEKETAHGSPQTPREFCRRLAAELPEADTALTQLAFLYGHVAYDATLPASYNPAYLRQLWDLMSNPRPIPSPALAK